MSRTDRENQMFPAALWFNRVSTWKPIFKGSDEWGRHTICVGIPFVLHAVIPTKPCYCADVAEYRCTFPGCPYMGIVPNSICQTHDAEFWREELSA